MTLAQNLELENQALLRHDASILEAVDHGDRLVEMQGALDDATASGLRPSSALPVRHHRRLAPRPVRAPGRLQPRARPARHRRSARPTTRRARCSRASRRRSRRPSRVRRATGDRWLNVAVLPPTRRGGHSPTAAATAVHDHDAGAVDASRTPSAADRLPRTRPRRRASCTRTSRRGRAARARSGSSRARRSRARRRPSSSRRVRRAAGLDLDHRADRVDVRPRLLDANAPASGRGAASPSPDGPSLRQTCTGAP